MSVFFPVSPSNSTNLNIIRPTTPLSGSSCTPNVLNTSNNVGYNVIDYILVAEFDIDKGSTITYQYPHPTGQDKQ